ncbi:MAG: methyltransferase domain-containing protein [Candidatus Marinimicrobia bacterium]|nr:methyltransferase domain-containing protein [Candidatus Neomarinimicrobiota bacterium]
MSKENDSVLRFYHEVLGLERLHYGLWLEKDQLTIDKLKEAQIRYENFLMEKIPEGVRSILDVGCGTGILAKNLLEKGYAVEGLSPDFHQQKNFTENIQAPFHHMRFGHLDLENYFDCLIMSESSQYIRKEKLFPTAAKALKNNGYLMVCDYFVWEKKNNELTKSGHLYNSFLNMAKAAGFKLLEERDITGSVVKTLCIGKEFVEKVLLTVEIFTQKFRSRHPFLSRLSKRLFRKKIAKLSSQMELLDAEAFKANKTYRFLLFQIEK